MDFTPDATTVDYCARVQAFLDECVYPAERVHAKQIEAGGWERTPVMAELSAEARRRGLWNLFLPGTLTNLQYAPLAELSGRSPALAPEAMNCAAPDTGNMELLHAFGTDEQRKQWLEPLLAAEIRSAFGMTELTSRHRTRATSPPGSSATATST